MTTSSSDPAGESESVGASILVGYVDQETFARANRASARTIKRYRDLPDGLPWTMWAGKVFIPIEEGRGWLKSRVRRPNQRRRAG